VPPSDSLDLLIYSPTSSGTTATETGNFRAKNEGRGTTRSRVGQRGRGAVSRDCVQKFALPPQAKVEGAEQAGSSSVMSSLNSLPDDALALLVAHITESKRPVRTVLRTISSLSKTCKGIHAVVHSRLSELRGLPVDVWEATSRKVPAQLTWTIRDFAHLDQERIYSPPFRNGDHTWRLLLFPNGDEVEKHRPGAQPHSSCYVDVADAAMLPHGWVREAHFVLTVVNKKKPSKTIAHYARHDFEGAKRDWGFRELVSMKALQDEKAGFLYDGQLTLHCKVWDVTEKMKMTERAALLQQRQRRAARMRAGGASSGVGASSASSTSFGSDDSVFLSRQAARVTVHSHVPLPLAPLSLSLSLSLCSAPRCRRDAHALTPHPSCSCLCAGARAARGAGAGSPAGRSRPCDSVFAAYFGGIDTSPRTRSVISSSWRSVSTRRHPRRRTAGPMSRRLLLRKTRPVQRRAAWSADYDPRMRPHRSPTLPMPHEPIMVTAHQYCGLRSRTDTRRPDERRRVAVWWSVSPRVSLDSQKAKATRETEVSGLRSRAESEVHRAWISPWPCAWHRAGRPGASRLRCHLAYGESR
jgi:hypothetical protein